MNSNFVPFKTINNYLFAKEHDAPRIIVTNLLGNLMAFMPMAFFLPTCLTPLKRLLPFTLCMIGLVLIVEVIQAITNVGFFDVDDLILNVTGAVIAFYICKLKIIQLVESKIVE